MSAQIIFGVVLSAVAVTLLFMILKNRYSRSRCTETANGELYIGNLSYQTSEDDLMQHFTQYGKINEVKIIKNNRTGRSKGYAFVRYSKTEDASRALASHGYQLNGRSLVVRIAKSHARN